METLYELLDETAAFALVVAHIDDEIIDAKVIAAAKEERYRKRIARHVAYLTRGEATTKNYLAHSGFDTKKDREREGKNGARAAGFASSKQFNGTDNALHLDADRLIPRVARWINVIGATLLVSTNKMGEKDSADHGTAARITLEAAELALKLRRGQGPGFINVLLPQPGMDGDLRLPPSQAGLELVGEIAVENASQFRMASYPVEDDWAQLSETHFMHPRDWAELEPYRLDRLSSYSVRQIGEPIVSRVVTL